MLFDVVKALRYCIYAIVEISVGVHRSDDQHNGCGMPYSQVPLIFNFVGKVSQFSTFVEEVSADIVDELSHKIDRVATRMIIEQDLADDTHPTR